MDLSLEEIEARLDLALGTGFEPSDPADSWKKPDDEEVEALLEEYARRLGVGGRPCPE